MHSLETMLPFKQKGSSIVSCCGTSIFWSATEQLWGVFCSYDRY